MQARSKSKSLPIADNDSSAYTSCRSRVCHVVVPEGDNKGQGGDLKGDNQCLVEEEVPAGEEA